MLVSFQFPITDLRDLFPKNSQEKLPVAEFLDSKNRKNEDVGRIHNFGGAQPSIGGYKTAVPSYGRYFEATNLVRFCEPKFKEFKPITRGAQISRRFYYDGISVGRFEISLANKAKGELKIGYIENLILRYSKLPVNIDLWKNKEQCEFTAVPFRFSTRHLNH